MSQISITGLTFCYDGSYDNIFDNVSFNIDTTWKLGFISRNGRGKTTFLKLLMGLYEFKGTITSDVKFEYFPYEINDENLNTLEIIDSINHNYETWKLQKELNLLDVDENVLYRPFETLSNGEQTKVLLATLFLKENGFLLIDEPTNHLDMSARDCVSSYLSQKSGFIMVSHDRDFLDKCIDHVLSINKTGIDVQKGNFSSWWYNKRLQDSYEMAENEKLKRDIQRLSQSAKKTATWSEMAENSKIGISPGRVEKSISRRSYEGEKSRKLMKQSKNIIRRKENAIEEKTSLLQNVESSFDLKINQFPYHSNTYVFCKDLSISYGERQIFSDISFTIEKGDRIAVTGKNGSGKSSIIKLICGENINYTGTFQKGSNFVISYVSQDTSHLNGSLTDYALSKGIDESLFKAILNKLDFSRIQFEKNIENYSEGQKKKVLIAGSLCEKAHLHIWDEPLNFIDIISRMQIEDLILSYKPTILFVEHDRAFCDKVSTKSVEL